MPSVSPCWHGPAGVVTVTLPGSVTNQDGGARGDPGTFATSLPASVGPSELEAGSWAAGAALARSQPTPGAQRPD